MPQGYYTDLLGGFQERQREVQKQNYDQSVADTEREQKIFSTLLASDDPEVQHLALTGLLDSANPKKKKGGIKGWLGETEQSPYLAAMQALVRTPVSKTTTGPNPAAGAHPALQPGITETLPSTQSVQGVPLAPSVQPSITETPDSAAPAGMASTSLVQQNGQAPPKPTSYTQTQAPPVPYSISRTTLEPRQVFMSPIEKQMQTEEAQARGQVRGRVAGRIEAGFTPEQARELERRQLGGTTGQTYAEGEITPDPTSPTGFSQTLYLRSDPTQTHKMPAAPPTSATRSWGVELEPIAMAVFGKPGSQLDQTQAGVLLQAQQLRKNQLTTQQAISAAQTFLPNATVDQQLALADFLRTSTAAQTGPATAAPAVAGGPPAPTSGTSLTAPPTPQGAATPPPRPATLGAGLDPALATASKESGKPMDPAIQTAVARTKQMNDIVGKAIAALEPYKNSTSLNDTMNLVAKYRAGTESDPLALAAAQLPDLAGLQQSASTLLGGASRSQRVYADKRQHVPRLPSGRQIMTAHLGLGADLVSGVSQLVGGDEGGFDSPAQMYQKLVGLKSANDAFLKDMIDTAQGPAIGPMASHPSTQPATATTPASTAVGTAYKDASGNWQIRQP